MKISIIVPIYNVEKYLQECLQSVADQTMTEGLECILVDDCGPDNSAQIARDFIASYRGPIYFRFIQREKNGGLSAARNTGIEAAQGDYLYFLDSDDTIIPETMELMYGLVEKYGALDLVQGSFYENEKQYKTISPYRMPEFTDNRKTIKSFLLKYEGDIVGAQSRLVRRDLFFKHKLFFKNGIIHEDNYWTFFLAKHVRSFAFCPISTYYHRYNPTSITGNVNIPKETIAYRTIIVDLSDNIDSYLPGHQKELILNNLITALRNGFYEDKNARYSLIKSFAKRNNFIENLLLKLYLSTYNSKVLHLLIRLYKIHD